MSAGIHVRPQVLAAKARLAEGREKLKARHLTGTPGIQICNAFTEVNDLAIQDVARAALMELNEAGPQGLIQQIALVAHGGYGRRDMAPYSDVDLMILHAPEAAARMAPLAQRLVRDLFDAGINLGQSVRTPRQACQLAMQDATICTSLLESRLLEGNAPLFNKFYDRLRRQARRGGRRLISTIDKARNEERTQYGETVYLLEPNLKRTRGGLRDIQLIRWIGSARYGTPDLDTLRLYGALTRTDYDSLRAARDFLLKLRNEMHFFAGKSNDVLDRAEQMRVAEVFGYQGTEGLMPVEQFMREYFRHTDAVSHIANRFLGNSRRAPRWVELMSPLFTHQYERDFRVGPLTISANRRGLAKLQSSLTEILRLADLANQYNKSIAHATTEAIYQAVPALPDEVTPEAARRFRSILSHSARLGELLRSLLEMGVLEKIIPAFGHARSLLQFNDYHKYTVDEHSLRAVERATEFAEQGGPLALVYNGIKRKWLLHLALLIHDLGKGFAEDHSELGRRIAAETGARLHLSMDDTETLKFLVHKHLTMSHLCFRRDTSDDQLVVKFAVEVGSPELLQMLFVLTCADLAAVGPGVLNAWKTEVLHDLYQRALQHLAGDASGGAKDELLALRRQEVQSVLPTDEASKEWFNKRLTALPAAYLRATPAAQIAADLQELRGLHAGQVATRGVYLNELHTTEYRISTLEGITPGVFHKLTGALTAQGLQILSAEITTLDGGLIFDRFFVHDPDFADAPPAGRLDEVCSAMAAALQTDAKGPAFRRLWRSGEQRTSLSLVPMPTQVRIDNHTSDRYTILDVFAADKTGLLYTVTHALFELGLSVSVAKIGTYLDQVVDVFYVTDQTNRKIEDEQRLRDIHQRLFAIIEEFERQAADKARIN